MKAWDRTRQLTGTLSVAVMIASAACQPQSALPASTGGAIGSTPAAATTPASVATSAPSGPSGTLTVAVAAPLITSLDTGAGNDAQTLQFMWPAFDGLTWLSSDGKINPGLAKSWKTVDPTTWEFTLGDYKFQNGRAVEAQDVVDTYTRTRDPDKKLPGRVIFTGAGIDKVSAPDAKTVRVTTMKPNPTIPNILQLSMILPVKELNATGDQEFFKKPIGTGPYKVESSDFSGSIKYTAMGKDFVSPRGVPNFKDLEIKIVPDLASRSAALRTGDVDLALALTNDQATQLEANGFKLFFTNGTASVHFNLDMFNPPTNDLRVRQAINYAIDKDTVLKAFYAGRGRVDSGQLIGTSVLGFNQSLQPYPFDQAKAKQLLAEAGYPNGFPIKLEIIQLSTVNKDLAQIIADQLKDVGIQVEIDLKETAVWLTDYYGTSDHRPGLFVQVINWDQTFEPDSVYRWFSSDVPLDGGRRWVDDEFDQLYQSAHAELDRTKRGQLYQQAAQRLHDQAPVLFGWQVNGVYAGKKDLTLSQPAHADYYITAKRG